MRLLAALLCVIALLSSAGYAAAQAAPRAREAPFASQLDYSGSLSATLDGIATGGPGQGGGGALRASLEGELWAGWLASPPPGRVGQLSIFAPVTLDQRRGLIARVSGSALLGARTAVPDELAAELSESLTLQLSPIVLAQRFSFERPVSFRDAFWRSGRGVTSIGGRFELPGLLSGPKVSINLFKLALDVDFYGKGGSFDERSADIHTAFVEYLGVASLRPMRVAVIDAHILDYAVELEDADGAPALREAIQIRAPVVSVAGLRLGARWSLGFEAGVGVMAPAHVAPITADPAAAGPRPHTDVLTPILSFDITHHATAQPFIPQWSPLFGRYSGALGPGFALGAAAFQRLDSTGSAADEGGQLMAEGRLALSERWTFTAAANAVIAQRMLTGDVALPAGAPAVGSVFFMGRIEAGVACQLSRRFYSKVSAYVERSDRDDPVGLGGPTPAGIVSRAGASLSLGAKLF